MRPPTSSRFFAVKLGSALNIVGLAAYGGKKAVEKVVDGLKFHG